MPAGCLRRWPLRSVHNPGCISHLARGTSMLQGSISVCFVVSAAVCSAAALAQGTPAPAPSSYAIPIGPGIGLDDAKKVAAAVSAEARQNKWFIAIAVVDPAGTLLYFEKADT